jgi:hypothetical protein
MKCLPKVELGKRGDGICVLIKGVIDPEVETPSTPNIWAAFCGIVGGGNDLVGSIPTSSVAEEFPKDRWE